MEIIKNLAEKIRLEKIIDHLSSLDFDEAKIIALSKERDLEEFRARAEVIRAEENERMHKVFSHSAVFLTGMMVAPLSMAVVGQVLPGPAAVGSALGMCAFVTLTVHAGVRKNLTEAKLYEAEQDLIKGLNEINDLVPANPAPEMTRE